MIEFLPPEDYSGALAPPATVDEAVAQLQQFTPNVDYATNLRRMLKVLAASYLDLLRLQLAPRTSAGTGPSEVALRRVEHGLLNTVHLLNILRRHQARQGVIAMMDRQVRETVAKAEALEARTIAAVSFLAANGQANVEALLPSRTDTHATPSAGGDVPQPAPPTSRFGIKRKAADGSGEDASDHPGKDAVG